MAISKHSRIMGSCITIAHYDKGEGLDDREHSKKESVREIEKRKNYEIRNDYSWLHLHAIGNISH